MYAQTEFMKSFLMCDPLVPPSQLNPIKVNAFREFEGRTADVLVVLVEKGMKKML